MVRNITVSVDGRLVPGVLEPQGTASVTTAVTIGRHAITGAAERITGGSYAILPLDVDVPGTGLVARVFCSDLNLRGTYEGQMSVGGRVYRYTMTLNQGGPAGVTISGTSRVEVVGALPTTLYGEFELTGTFNRSEVTIRDLRFTRGDSDAARPGMNDAQCLKRATYSYDPGRTLDGVVNSPCGNGTATLTRTGDTGLSSAAYGWFEVGR